MNIYYDKESDCYRTIPDGDKLNESQIKEMIEQKHAKSEFELDIEFEIDANNRVDMIQVTDLVIAYNKLLRVYEQLKKCYCDRSDCSGRIINSRKYDSIQQNFDKQLNNWNKLKEYLHNVDVVIDYSENYDGRFINYDELVNKMQELEKGSDNCEIF